MGDALLLLSCGTMARFADADGCFAFFFLFCGRVVGMLVLGFENHSNGRVIFSQLSSRWLSCARIQKANQSCATMLPSLAHPFQQSGEKRCGKGGSYFSNTE
jgi:hypothetical protein